MFDFLFDEPYENRKVARHETEALLVSTAKCNDGDCPYETAIRHADYNDDELVIVEAYRTKDEALAGHAKWVSVMTAEELPESLTDCRNSKISQMLDGPIVYARNGSS